MDLQNNSNEMKTVVETFVIEETASLIYDNEKLDKWNARVEELGLTGQSKIRHPEKSPIPFMHMKDSLKNVFECLCPRKVLARDYDVSPIPLEILDLIALSEKEGYFKKIEIWYDEKSPDPVCVGLTGYWQESSYHSDSNKTIANQKFESEQEARDAGANHPWFNNTNKYLLGKWADVKHSFEELKKMATDRFIGMRRNEALQQIKTYQRQIDDLETDAFNLFN